MKKEELINEAEKLRKQIAKLKASAAQHKSNAIQLARERDLVRTYVDFAGVIIVVINKDQTVTLINNVGARLLGYRKNEIIGKTWFDNFVPERTRGAVIDGFNKLLSGRIRTVEYFENPVLTKSGEEKLIAWHNTILKDKKGDIFATLSSGDDITERKQIFEDLKSNEERFRTIVENINVGIYRIGIYKNKGGPYGRLMQANDALAQMLGYDSVKALLVSNIAEHYHDQQERQRFIADIVRTGFVKDRELRLLAKNGASLWVAITGKAQYDEQGAIKWIDGIIEDVSDRKRMEEELRALSLIDELTGLYNRRGFLTLAGQQLRIAKRTKRQQLLLFADLDDLKRINDHLGHALGDQALRDTAQIFKATFRTSDILARMGGDEACRRPSVPVMLSPAAGSACRSASA
ncbi:MAG: PAS domain S-box protein [Proteobacteria bacterium]|nr:PAS domain S-box protein [Pseudomonadota bacterium]